MVFSGKELLEKELLQNTSATWCLIVAFHIFSGKDRERSRSRSGLVDFRKVLTWLGEI